MAKKIGRPEVTKSAAEQNYVRAALQETGLAQYHIAETAKVNQSNISKFMAGKTRLSDPAIERLYRTGTVRRPEPHEVEEPKEAPPMEAWQGELKTVSQVSEEKGYCPSTIRKWARAGKINYLRKGRRILICCDAALAAIPKSEKAILRERVASLEAENAELREQNRKMQMRFDFADQADADQADADQADADQADADQADADQADADQAWGYFPVYCDGDQVAGWLMEAAPDDCATWRAIMKNGINNRITLQLSQKIWQKIIVDRSKKWISVPAKLARKLEAENLWK